SSGTKRCGWVRFVAMAGMANLSGVGAVFTIIPYGRQRLRAFPAFTEVCRQPPAYRRACQLWPHWGQVTLFHAVPSIGWCSDFNVAPASIPQRGQARGRRFDLSLIASIPYKSREMA